MVAFNYGSIDGVKANLPRMAARIVDVPQDKLDIPSSDVETFLSEYSAKIDGILKGKYPLPIPADSESKTLLDAVADNLAAYKLARRYWINVDASENKDLSDMRSEANDVLKGLRDGSFSLPDVDIEPIEDEFDVPDYDSETIFDMEDESTWQAKI